MPSEDLVLSTDLTDLLESMGKVVEKGDVSGGVVKRYVHGFMQAAASGVAALAGLPKCQLASPHEDILTGYDSGGNLRLECMHSPQHCWDLGGRRGKC